MSQKGTQSSPTDTVCMTSHASMRRGELVHRKNKSELLLKNFDYSNNKLFKTVEKVRYFILEFFYYGRGDFVKYQGRDSSVNKEDQSTPDGIYRCYGCN